MSPSVEAERSEDRDPDLTVLVTHHRRAPLDVSEARARRLLDQGAASWSALGAADRPLRIVTTLDDLPSSAARRVPDSRTALAAVHRSRRTLGIVRASEVDETVRVVSVGGVDPLRSPARYPLRAGEAAPTPDVVTMTFTGDVMLGRRVGDYLDTVGDPAAVLRPLAPRLRSADIAVTNLESTLSQAGSPTQGGDSFGADPSVRRGLRLAGLDVIGLANNHLGDYGDTAMLRTFERLRARGLPYVGAGADRAEARRPLVVERSGTRVAFVAFDAIGETPAATADGPGANRLSMPPRTGPLDRDRLRRLAAQVRTLSGRVDTVVVLAHWGTQYTNVPEPVQSRVARRLADAGADLVVGGHPHWLQGWENAGGTLVVHSLGNTVFDMDFQQRTQEGALLEVVLWDGELKAADLVPYVIGSDDFTPRVVRGSRARTVLETAWETSTGPYGR
ncbi:UNVERIFIED_CONTAM: hypothetical protein LK11_10090 [Mumia flava]